MKKIPLKNDQERKEVIELLKKEVPYSKIMEKYDIGKSSLSEYKKKIKESEKKNTEPKEELTEPKEKKSGAKKQKISPDPVKNFDQEEKKIVDHLLSEIEFQTFKNSVEIIYQSSYKRFDSAKARGMLNALKTIKITMETLKKRLGY